MKEFWTRIRARYPETDRMGIVHHTNHLVWFEIGRTELLREIGMPYAALEEAKVFMPVIEVGVRYKRPVRYDEEIDVVTRVEDVTGVCVRFGYRLVRHLTGEPVATGYTLHASTDERGAPRRMSGTLKEQLGGLAAGAGALS